MALRRRGLAAEIVGLVRREQSAAEALAAGVVDTARLELEPVLKGSDLVIFCTPLSQMRSLASGFNGLLEANAIVTDVGSAKRAVIDAIESLIATAGGHFIGSHPMAGSERTGVKAAREDLFEGAVTVVTPTPGSSPRAVEQVVELWESVGSRVVTMPAARHDELVSRSSHLPHLVAAALVNGILSSGDAGEIGSLCAAGFRDTTRVASGSPEMWRDIGIANRDAILKALEGFENSLRELRNALESTDGRALDTFLTTAKERRDGWCERGQKATGE
jgi:prephenate dehydrogenase